MIFTETKLAGATIIDTERHEDERGFFARIWCEREFESQGLTMRPVQCSISANKRRGTLRGMHYQEPPHEETKLVCCLKGAIYDVIIDLRPKSSTYKQWIAVELNADNHRALYVPEGFAHGFMTLTDDATVFYQISEFYHPESTRGVRWNDPCFGIDWPLEASILCDRDRSYANFDPALKE